MSSDDEREKQTATSHIQTTLTGASSSSSPSSAPRIARVVPRATSAPRRRRPALPRLLLLLMHLSPAPQREGRKPVDDAGRPCNSAGTHYRTSSNLDILFKSISSCDHFGGRLLWCSALVLLALSACREHFWFLCRFGGGLCTTMGVPIATSPDISSRDY